MIYSRREWKPKKNAPVVQKLLDNGCIFCMFLFGACVLN